MVVQYKWGDSMTTGQYIQQARKKARLTQAELGARLGVSGSMIGQYENGFRNPKPETLQRIAVALGLKSHYDLFPKGRGVMADMIEAEEILGLINDESSEPENERLLFSAFSMLNNRGQRVAVQRLQELAQIPDYQRIDDPQAPEE